jgi:hypothetical protein
MISKNSGGADQPVSRLMESGGEAYMVDASARTPSASDRNMVCWCMGGRQRQDSKRVVIYPGFYNVECGDYFGCLRR